jgi:hypothetical protein
MLNDVQRRPLLVHPTREDAPPALVELQHINLEEGASKLIGFPGRRPVARAKPNNDVADPPRLPRLQPELARFTVSLVQDAENRDALVHRCRGGVRHAAICIDRDRLGAACCGVALTTGDHQVFGGIVARLVVAAVTCPQSKQQRQGCCACGPMHHASGVQAS